LASLQGIWNTTNSTPLISAFVKRQDAGAPDRLSVSIIEHFLRTADETWDGAGSGQFTTAQFQNNEAYRRAVKNAMRALFHTLANLLPAGAQLAPHIDPEAIRPRVGPMVKGLVQEDWQEVALRELVSRTFVLNLRGAEAAMEVELPSCDMESPWRILWALYGDYGLKPDDIEMVCDGLAGDFAHVRWLAYETQDPYSDVVVHETAHLLHYLKPRNFGLNVRRHQERFVDIEFRHRELFAYACGAYARVVLHGERKDRAHIPHNRARSSRASGAPRTPASRSAAFVRTTPPDAPMGHLRSALQPESLPAPRTPSASA
jgi:hypothetical protein